MISRKYKKKTKYSRLHVTMSVFMITTIIIVACLEFFVAPIVVKAGEYQGKMILTNIVSNAVNEVLEDAGISYQDIVTIQRDQNDKITSIESNIYTINKIKTKVISVVSKAFANLPSHHYSLPLGTLLGNHFFIGRGPNVELTIIPMGYLDAQIVSECQASGINQTNYKVMLNMTLNYTTMIPLHKSSAKLISNFMIMDTLIVGEVPQYYTNLNGDNRMIYPQSTK